jgi:glycosyltransferase involved in cell wall biosynthesis
MLNILALIDTYQVNGPCRGLLQLAGQAKEHGGRFIIGLFFKRQHRTSPAFEECRKRGIEVDVLHQTRRYDPWVIFKAWRMVKGQRVEVLQSHGYKPTVLAWLLKRLMHVPWIAVMHGHTNENKWVVLYNKIDLWAARSADRVITVSSSMKTLLKNSGIPEQRIRVIPNAIDPRAYHLDCDGVEFRSRCGAGADNVLVGVIGRLSPEKGHEIFLQAFARVTASVPNAKAVFVGEGQEADRLEAMIRLSDLKEHVAFVGYHTNISLVYSALDLVVIPSLSEGLPNVLLEAFLHRKAVVATAVGGIPEVMQGELSSWLVPPRNAEALASSIIRALESRDTRDAVASLGEHIVRAQFSPSRRAEQFFAVYREVTSGCQSPTSL